VNKVLAYSQWVRESRLHTDALMHEWEIHKNFFIERMGGVIYEHPEPVTFELDEDSRQDKVDEFLDWVVHEVGEEMYEFFKQNYDGILENKTIIPCYGFPAGMKLSRVLLKHFGVEAEDVRQRLSMLIQSNKITGTLCVSVHPLDFLSSSENQHSWRSCHALDGEYRSGNLSYMCDYCTFMVYLKSTEDTHLPRFPEDVPWNNKKWRCLFFNDYDNRQIWAGRQYPFHSDTALKVVADILYKFDYFGPEGSSKRFQSNFYWEDTPRPQFFEDTLRGDVILGSHPKHFDDTYVFLGRDNITLKPLRKYIYTPEKAMCFNDLIDSHTYAPWVLRYQWPFDWIPHDIKVFQVGEKAPCICCGPKNDVAFSDVMFCKECLLKWGPSDHEAVTYCARCDTPIIREDAHYCEETDSYYCDDCWEESN